jgi:hypothetical protein
MKRATIGVLATAALVAGCSDSTGITGDRLTRQEALAVAEDVAHSGEAGYTSSRQEGSSAASAAESTPTTITFDHTSRHPCPVSGRVEIDLAIELEVDAQAHSFDYNSEGTLSHEACAFVKDDVTLTIDGDPSLSFQSQASGVGLQLQPFQFEADGEFDWSASDGRSGHCTIEIETMTDFVAKRRTVQGDVCGHTIDQTFTWT